MGRTAALLALAGALIAWYEVVPHLGRTSQWSSTLLITLLLIPALFGTVWLALPFRTSPRLLLAIAVLLVLTLGLGWLGLDLWANFAKFALMTLIGWWFLSFFEALSWVVGVALLIPWVDAYSVWRGPTKVITQEHAHVFDSLSVAFVLPGGESARLGLPDILFFAVFLSASARFRLRPFPTWLGMTAGVGVTMVIVIWLNVGLPALPGIALGFLLPNADLIWRRLRSEPWLGDRPEVAIDRPADD